MSEILRAITELQNQKVIHIADYRRAKRMGLEIPIYSLAARRTRKLDTHSLLAGVTSERLVEYGFVARNLVPKSRKATVLDVGSAGSDLVKAIREFGKKFRVLGIDLAQCCCDARMDARFMAMRNQVIDQIICVSTIEQIRLSSGVEEQSGDLEAMREMLRVLKKGGRAIVTAPYGTGRTPEYRLYDRKALDRIVGEFSVVKEEFYRYDAGIWKRCSESLAKKTESKVPDYFHSAVCVCLLLEKR
ncbi:MAG: class I SAM-dependent methyltransferase [Nitrososphaera sp.]